MSYYRAGFGMTAAARQFMLAPLQAAKPVATVLAPTAPAPTGVTVPPPVGTVPATGPTALQPVLVGPTPLPSGGGGSGGDGGGSVPTTDGGGWMTQPVVLVGLAVLGVWALSRARGTRRY